MSVVAESSPKVVQAFIASLEEMLEALHEVFPDCKRVKEAVDDFKKDVKPNPMMHKFVIKGWHAEVSPYYEHIRKRDVDTLIHANISMFKKVDIAGKWKDPNFNTESRDALFEYMDILNQHSCLYCGLPSNVMSKIEQTAMGLISDMESGKVQPQDLTFQGLSQNILGNMTEKDMEEFMQNMPQMQNTMMSLLGSIPGGQQGTTGMPDLGALFQMLPKLMPQQPPPPRR